MTKTPPSILVVEDDLDCRAVLVDLLELSGYAVQACSGAHEALRVAKANAPSVLIADLNLGDADGAWLVRAFRDAGGALSAVPVILTTGASDAREVGQALGVVTLPKPYDATRLLDVVGKLVQRSAT